MKRLAIILAAAALAACAGLQPKPAPDVKLACQTAPQWITNDAQGRPNTAIFVCFGEDHKLLWTSRALTFDEIVKLVTPPAAAAVPAPAAPAATPQAPVTPSASPAPAASSMPAPVAPATAPVK